MLQFKFLFGLNNFKLVYSFLFHIPLSEVYCQDLGQRKKLSTTFSSCMLSRNLVGLTMQKIDLPFIHMQVIFPFVWFVMLIVCKQNKSFSAMFSYYCYYFYANRCILIRRRQCGRVVRAPDLESGGPGFKSRSDHYLELFLGSPKFNSSASLVK